ncbi:MAG: hypothetical protein NXI32_20175 [bacterium]|nr:hypothetical protein [bacterium]
MLRRYLLAGAISAACLTSAVVLPNGLGAKEHGALALSGFTGDWLIPETSTPDVKPNGAVVNEAEVLEGWEYTLRTRPPKCRGRGSRNP